jgi:hypothetical protein
VKLSTAELELIAGIESIRKPREARRQAVDVGGEPTKPKDKLWFECKKEEVKVTLLFAGDGQHL